MDLAEDLASHAFEIGLRGVGITATGEATYVEYEAGGQYYSLYLSPDLVSGRAPMAEYHFSRLKEIMEKNANL